MYNSHASRKILVSTFWGAVSSEITFFVVETAIFELRTCAAARLHALFHFLSIATNRAPIRSILLEIFKFTFSTRPKKNYLFRYISICPRMTLEATPV